jgi:hypothetical protein
MADPRESFRQLDRLLRGEVTRAEALSDGKLEFPVGGIITVSLLLGVMHGVCVGVFSLTGSGSGALLQIPASALKVPALFVLTLVVTFPSLYVFNALLDTKLSLTSILRLLVASTAIMLTVLASLGPIVAFFALTTTSYPFMKLLNVAVCVVAGWLGCGFLLRTLKRLALQRLASEDPVPPVLSVSAVPQTKAEIDAGAKPLVLRAEVRRPEASGAIGVFRLWIIVFAIVGAQMSWILRPFVGDPSQPFQWFRPHTSNFFESVWLAIQRL